MRKVSKLVLVALLLAVIPTHAQVTQITFGFKGIQGELEIYHELIAEFQRLNPDVEVTLINLVGGGDWLDQLLVMTIGGTTPDVCVMEYQRSIPLIIQNVFMPLDELIKQDQTFSLDDYIPAAVNAHTYEGRLYGIPREIQPFTLFVNKDELNRAGLAYPTTDWDIYEMQDLARKMSFDTSGDGVMDIWGWRVDITLTRLAPFFHAFGAEFLDATRTQCLLDDQKAIDALQFLYDAMHTYNALAPLTVSPRFENANVGFYLGGPWMVPDFRKLSFDWDIAVVPKGPGGWGTTLGSDAYLISRQTAHVDAAWRFVKFLAGPYAQAKMVELGHVIPSLTELVAGPEFQNPTNRPYNVEAYNVGFEIAKPSPVNLYWEDFQEIFQRQMNLALSGLMSPSQALGQLAFEANLIFTFQ